MWREALGADEGRTTRTVNGLIRHLHVCLVIMLSSLCDGDYKRKSNANKS